MTNVLVRAIKDLRIEAEFIHLGEPTPTAPDAARVLGVTLEQIIKSLVFVDRQGESILAIVTGSSRVDAAKLRAFTGLARLKLAHPEFALRRTGYPVGSMPPVAHAPHIPVVIDLRVSAQDRVFGGAGIPEAMIAIAPSEIIRTTGGIVGDIAE